LSGIPDHRPTQQMDGSVSREKNRCNGVYASLTSLCLADTECLQRQSLARFAESARTRAALLSFRRVELLAEIQRGFALAHRPFV
jgi:hypothetical protein